MSRTGITETVEVISNTALLPGHYRMTLGWNPADVRPGQFVMLRTGHGFDPLLRRPFCIYNTKEGCVEILYRVVGRGTSIMAGLKRGDRVDVLGPLGNGFELSEIDDVLMVAGGMGIVPFYLVAKELLKRGKTPGLLYGVKKEEELTLADDLRELGVKISSVVEERDGRLVTELLEETPPAGKTVLACGPREMLKRVASLCESRGVECLVSLETSMACGMGVCMGCAVETPAGYRMVCADGPVFNARELKWTP